MHAADIHLGYEQYNLRARADDFGKAFVRVSEYAREERVDFVLIAGDLFHKASVDAWTLKQATYALEPLRKVGIPVLAIEGNHDAQHSGKHMSWLEYLNSVGLLNLLDVQIDNLGRKVLVPWDEDTGKGSYIDIGAARIYGIRYMGAQTARMIEDLADQIVKNSDGFTILMLHAGIEGAIPHAHGGLTMGQLAPLRKHVDYVATGHVHKRLQRDNWLFNPGSTETCSMEETGVDWPHGFFDVTVRPGNPFELEVAPVSTVGRPFCRVNVDILDARTTDDVVSQAEAVILNRQNIPEGAVVEIALTGIAPLKRQDIPQERIKAVAEAAFRPLTLRMRNNISPPGIIREGQQRLPRQELERAILEQLVSQRLEYRDDAKAWTQLILGVKSMVRDDAAPSNIVAYIKAEKERMKEPEGPCEVDLGEAKLNIDEPSGQGEVVERPPIPDRR